MSIIQFLRILWARRWITLAVTVSCLVGAMFIAQALPPRYEAHTRVVLELLKPDPVTGTINQNATTRGYVTTQAEMIKDYAVAGQVADDLGLLSDPALIASYQKRPKNDQRDFRRWVTQLIVDRTDARMVEGSNILEITYTAPSAENARMMADALRKAYIEASRNFRVDAASKNQQWYEEQAQKAQEALDEAEKIKTQYERDNNIIIEDEGKDLQSMRLQTLASAAAVPTSVVSAPATSAARSEMAAVDATISEQSQILGPNHPELQALRTKRAALAQQALQDDANARRMAQATASASAANVGAVQAALAAQQNLVMSKRDKVEKGRQLQADVELRRELYKETMKRVAEFRHEAAAPVTGITVLGSAVAPQAPKFPNKPLIVFGSLMLGLGGGVGIGLLMELFGRRVRGPEDLRILDAPVLAVIANSGGLRNRMFRLPRISGGSGSRKKPSSTVKPLDSVAA